MQLMVVLTLVTLTSALYTAMDDGDYKAALEPISKPMIKEAIKALEAAVKSKKPPVTDNFIIDTVKTPMLEAIKKNLNYFLNFLFTYDMVSTDWPQGLHYIIDKVFNDHDVQTMATKLKGSKMSDSNHAVENITDYIRGVIDGFTPKTPKLPKIS